MSYLKEIQAQIKKRDFSKILLLWEEYCSDDRVDPEEFAEILQVLKTSDFAVPFGKYSDTGFRLRDTIEDKKSSYRVFRLLIDLHTGKDEALAEKAISILEETYGNDPEYQERMRLIGLKPLGDFQGAVSNYDLLAHMAVGKCVFHTGGWGTGEIVELSLIREQLGVEFEYVAGRKHITFRNAFKCLIPLEDSHFLARRFVDPDTLEEEAKKDAIAVIKILLRDLGPLSAAEIKDELCELVIPEKDWTKWWQNARVKLKKDTLIEVPSSLKEPFVLRKTEVSHEEQLQKEMLSLSDISEVIQTFYNYVRDFPNILRNSGIKKSINEKLTGLLHSPDLKPYQELQIYIFMESLPDKNPDNEKSVKELVVLSKDIEALINNVEIIAFKKRALVALREYREDWQERFLSLLTKISQSQLRDYLIKELNNGAARELLKDKLKELLVNPLRAPELFVWYFQKLLVDPEENLPFSDKEGTCRFAESYLVLLHKIENHSDYRDLTKKMHLLLINKRYEIVRQIFENADIEFIKEFLLLASKCQVFSDHDHKILLSLAKVVHSELGPDKKSDEHLDGNILWTTEAGYHKIQNRARHIGTVEIVENAREVEAARALGDLRENSEYKFATEKRRQLQNELKTLSEELNKARLITTLDIPTGEIGIGSIVDLSVEGSPPLRYTILGPWDADVDLNILSFQSKLAQAMIGKKVDDKFSFRDQEYQIMSIKSFLDS